MGLVPTGRAMLRKSLIQVSVDGQGLCWPNYDGNNEDNETSFKRSYACTGALSAPDPAPGHGQATPPPETPGPSRASLDQSLVGSLLLYPGSWCTQGSVCALQEPISAVLCKFWQLCGGVNGNLLQEGLCHTQVCCTQSPCPCGRPLLTRTSTERHSNSSVSVSVVFLGPSVHQLCLSPLSGVWGLMLTFGE